MSLSDASQFTIAFHAFRALTLARNCLGERPNAFRNPREIVSTRKPV